LRLWVWDVRFHVQIHEQTNRQRLDGPFTEARQVESLLVDKNHAQGAIAFLFKIRGE
jgi:hypothetical protein